MKKYTIKICFAHDDRPLTSEDLNNENYSSLIWRFIECEGNNDKEAILNAIKKASEQGYNEDNYYYPINIDIM